MNDLERIDRRTALKWIAATTALFPSLEWSGVGAAPVSNWTLTDPNLLKPGVPWGRVLNSEELRTLSALCDVIIPADEKSAGAATLKVQDFIDEWVSAPYPVQQTDQKTVREGIAWLNEESKRRQQKTFAELADPEKRGICDEICYLPRAANKTAAQFFARVRDLTATAFYTTQEGMKDLQYIGNVPLAAFRGPPPEVLTRLKLT